jgi:hypothetical protein
MHQHSHPTSAVRLQEEERTSQPSAPAQPLFVASAVASPLLADHVSHAADRVASAEVAQESTSRVPPAPVAEASSVVVCPEAVEASSAAAAELVVVAEEAPLDLVVKARREATTAAQAATKSA